MTTASPDWRGYEYVIIDWRMTRCGVVYRVVGLKSITGSACVNDSLICVGVARRFWNKRELCVMGKAKKGMRRGVWSGVGGDEPLSSLRSKGNRREHTLLWSSREV